MAKEKSLNLDPITEAPGAHPVGTGVGAAVGGAAAGAAAGAFGGPVGVVAGGVIGAVAGGLGGKVVAESVNPTAEAAYWRQNYDREPYYQAGRTYDDYAPAYDLGLQARTSYDGGFDDYEERLESDWDSKKASSSLSWPQARGAARAAWDRVDTQYAGAGVAGTTAATFSPNTTSPIDNTSYDSEGYDNDDVVDTLNDLLEASRDGEYGFNAAAEHAEASNIKDILRRHASECRSAGEELQTVVIQLGAEPADGGTTAGALHRGWVAVRETLSTYSDLAVLDECERGEDSAVASYRKALKQNLPPKIRSLVERQAQGAQRNHDEIKALRDSLKANR